MEEIKLKSTSRSSALTDPVVLRETNTTRLLFKPLIVNNVHDQNAAVKGSFVFQRKNNKQQWVDYKDLNLSQLKAGNWIKLDLKSAEVLRLYKYLTDLYAIYKQEGIPSGEKRFLRADEGLGALLNANEDELNYLLKRETDNASVLLSRMLQWLSKVDVPEQVIDNLERLDIVGLQRLNGIVGLTTLKSSYQIWINNRENSDEEFWQTTLENYAFVLSQVFAYPVVIVEGKAYVGGKSIGNRGGNLVDFLAKNEVSNNAVLIEIKTPETELLGTQYRGNVFNISRDLSGAIIQVSNYKHSLQNEYFNLRQQSSVDFGSFEPSCVVIAGDFEQEINTEKKAKSFELFRSHLSGVEIITYDEMFGKVKLLIDLLEGNLVPENLDDDIPF